MSLFQFKEFSINQEGASMKVGTDSMILGAFIDSEQKKIGLDIGTGTGVLSLMVAQKNKHLVLHAIDIDENNISLANENFKKSKFENTFETINGDFLNFKPKIKYDLIFSNPPYYENGLLNKDKRKSDSRHEQSLPLKQLFNKTAQLLSSDGDFWIVLPSSNSDKWITYAQSLQLFINELYLIEGKEGVLSRVVCRFSLMKCDLSQETLIIRDSKNNYTEKYKALTIDFHGVKL